MDFFRIEENPFRCGRLTRVNVRDDTDIASLFEGIFSRHNILATTSQGAQTSRPARSPHFLELALLLSTIGISLYKTNEKQSLQIAW
jgi:hypothetical protein